MYTDIGTIAYLGDESSYSYAAASRLTSCKLVGYGTMTEVIAAADGECVGAVLPLENNVEGTVNEVIDCLFDSGLFIAAELVLPVRHCLIAEAGRKLSDIKKVVSHAQAIAQCREYIKRLGLPVEAVSSTSAALNAAKGDIAAIAHAPKAGQAVLDTNIQDSELNATRFALLTRKASREGDKVSVSFDLPNESGALLKALEVIYLHGVNMTRILSRPHRSGDGKYRFFVDFDYTGPDDELNKFLDKLRQKCSAFKCLGRFYCDQ